MRNWIHTAHFNARAKRMGYADYEQAISDLYARGWSTSQIAGALGTFATAVGLAVGALLSAITASLSVRQFFAVP